MDGILRVAMNQMPISIELTGTYKYRGCIVAIGKTHQKNPIFSIYFKPLLNCLHSGPSIGKAHSYLTLKSVNLSIIFTLCCHSIQNIQFRANHARSHKSTLPLKSISAPLHPLLLPIHSSSQCKAKKTKSSKST